MKHKILVTGGAGFIASHVVDAYVEAGHRVVVIDNLLTGSRKNVNPGAKFYKADIRNFAQMERIFKRERPEAVNHHAALISVTDSMKDPRGTFATNVAGTLNIILAFDKCGRGAKKLIFSSTGGAIYGSPKKLPVDESVSPDPLSPYALSKHFGEQMIAYYCGTYGINYVILRYANVYGPRQKFQKGAGIFPVFLNNIKKGARPAIFGDGGKTRDYVYVEDVARANLLALTRGKNATVNIASGKETSDYQIFQAIARQLNFQKAPIYAPKRKGEVERIALNPAKAKKILGWTPKVKFEEGIRKTLVGR